MRLNLLSLAVVAMLTLWGCSKAPEAPAAPQATITLKDGGKFTGAVTASTTDAMTLTSPGGEARTYPMSQVLSVKYADSVPAAPEQTSEQKPSPVSSPAPAPKTAVAPVTAPAAPLRPVEEFRTIPAGTSIEVRNNEAISSQTAGVGQTFSAVVAEDVLDTSGELAIPKGSNARLVVRAVAGQGKLQGQSELAVDLSSVTVGGREYHLDTVDIVERGKEGVGMNKRTGIFAGGGAAVGGIIGALAGGGKGAAIGAASGAGAGTAGQALTRGKAVHIPSETLLAFQLENPVRIHEAH